MEKIKGFKGFDKDLKCRGFQYEVGKEYEQKGEIRCCDNGFHFCEDPFDALDYYHPTNSRYCEVEGEGEIDRGAKKLQFLISILVMNLIGIALSMLVLGLFLIK